MKKFLLITVLGLVIGCTNVNAQTPLQFHFFKTDSNIVQPQKPKAQQPQGTSDELRIQAEILAELKAEKAANALKDEQIKALNGQIGAQSMTIILLTEQKEFYKTAALDRRTAGTLDDQNILLLRQQIADDRSEIKDLRNENDKLRSSRDTRTIISLIGGAALGYMAHR